MIRSKLQFSNRCHQLTAKHLGMRPATWTGRGGFESPENESDLAKLSMLLTLRLNRKNAIPGLVKDISEKQDS